MPEVSMRHFTCARDYCDNAAAVMPPQSLYFVNWDPFCFPLYYYQNVLKQRPDLVVVDQQLLRRSWYVRGLREHRPEFAGRVRREINAFLDAVAPFEDRRPYDGIRLQNCYIAMIDAMIDSTLARGNSVYFSFVPEPAIMRSYQLESQLVSYKYGRGGPDRSVTDAGLTMAGFIDTVACRDRMARHVREYYGNMYGMRGLLLEGAGDRAAARECFGKALRFFDPHSPQARFAGAKAAER
jgi:hypothetical protein